MDPRSDISEACDRLITVGKDLADWARLCGREDTVETLSALGSELETIIHRMDHHG